MKHSKLLSWLLAPFFMFADDESGGGAIDRGDDFDPGAADPEADAQAKADADAEAKRIEDEAAAKAASGGDDADKADKMIPVGRHKAMLDKAREERDALAAKVAQYEKGTAARVTNDEIKAVEDKVLSKEAEYNKLLIDGETEKATAVMREIRMLERQIGDNKAEMKAQAATAAAVESIRYDTTVERLEAAYPQLNPDREEFDKGAVAEVMELASAYEMKGHAPYAALQKAVKLIMGTTTQKQETAASAKPQVDATAVEKAARAEAATKKAIDAAQKTPPALGKTGTDSDKLGGGELTADMIMKMDQKKFAKLDEQTLARARGDFL